MVLFKAMRAAKTGGQSRSSRSSGSRGSGASSFLDGAGSPFVLIALLVFLVYTIKYMEDNAPKRLTPEYKTINNWLFRN